MVQLQNDYADTRSANHGSNSSTSHHQKRERKKHREEQQQWVIFIYTEYFTRSASVIVTVCHNIDITLIIIIFRNKGRLVHHRVRGNPRQQYLQILLLSFITYIEDMFILLYHKAISISQLGN